MSWYLDDSSRHHADAADSDDAPAPVPRGVPGRRTLTERLPPSAASIARAVVAQLARAPSATSAPLEASEALATAARGTAGGGGPLPFLDEIQRAFGRHDVSGVSAHVGGAAAEASEALGAQAYAAGDAVAFARAPDLRLAAHEATHVVQQRAGVQLASAVGAPGDAYERHADQVAELVVRGQSAEAVLDEHAGGGAHAAVQRFTRTDEHPEHARLQGPDEQQGPDAQQDEAAPPETAPQAPDAAPADQDLASKLHAISGRISAQRARQIAPHVRAAMVRFHISSNANQAMFLAQCAAETGGYSAFREVGSEEHFDRVYANRLGNREAHDGSRYRGAGAIQVTGRGAFARHGRRIGVDLEAHPELASQDNVAFLFAASYWDIRHGQPMSFLQRGRRAAEDWSGLPAGVLGQPLRVIAEAGTGLCYDYISVTINGGVPHENLPRRHAFFDRAAPLFGLSPGPAVPEAGAGPGGPAHASPQTADSAPPPAQDAAEGHPRPVAGGEP